MARSDQDKAYAIVNAALVALDEPDLFASEVAVSGEVGISVSLSIKIPLGLDEEGKEQFSPHGISSFLWVESILADGLDGVKAHLQELLTTLRRK